MANASTVPQLYNHTALQRVNASELNDISSLGADLDAESGWNALSASGCVIDGFHVAYSSGRAFSISDGAAIYKGQILKGVGVPNVELEINADANPRIDVVYIAGITPELSTPVPKTALGPYTRTPVAAEAVGTGDDSTKAFDLAQSRVDGRTLKVRLGGSAAGGWNLSPGTGTAGVDQIIFGTAPGAGVEIQADYTWESGGAEASANLSIRSLLKPQVLVATGIAGVTPIVQPTLNPETDIVLAWVLVPGSWTTGPVTSVINEAKQFFLHPDQNVDSASPITPTPPDDGAPRSGRIASVLRNIDQVLMGGRMRYADVGATSDTLEITPIWANVGGYSIHTPDESLSLQLVYAVTKTQPYHVTSTGWWYIYMYPQADAEPGTAPLLAASQSPPNSRRRDSGTEGGIYVGAVWITSTSPVTIKPFYTHGQWTFWQVATAFTISTGTNPADVSAACPSTGRLCMATVKLDGIAGSVGDSRSAVLKSHREGTAQPEPQVRSHLEPSQTSSLVQIHNSGIVRAEEYEGARWVHTNMGTVGSFSSESSTFELSGYIDDYRTMDQNGNVPTIY